MIRLFQRLPLPRTTLLCGHRTLSHIRHVTPFRSVFTPSKLRLQKQQDGNPAEKEESGFLFDNIVSKAEVENPDMITNALKDLPNTRGKYREQICRTPMLKTSTKRMNLIAHLIKGLDVEDAMAQLMFLKRNHCKEILWAIQEGCKIAKNIQGVDPRKLYVAYTYVCRGTYQKKKDIKGRGRCGIIRSPEAYMVIMLREKSARKPEKESKQPTKKRNYGQDKRVLNPRIPL